MKLLKYGDAGPLVELMQTALNRARFSSGGIDGIFGNRTQDAVKAFQKSVGLTSDGVAGSQTHRALLPYYLGYVVHTVGSRDTLYRIAMAYDTTIRAIEIANPGVDPLALTVGSMLVVPLAFAVVPSDINMGSTAISYSVRGLAARYPFLTLGEAGRSVMGKPIYYLDFGEGNNRVLYNAAHHANEWITTPVLLKFIEDISRAYAYNGMIFNISAADIYAMSKIRTVPAVNPDGIDLVVGELTEGLYYENARRLSGNYPNIPFPNGWKANIRGTDLNLQYPAGWAEARRIKFSQGFTLPGPRDYVGSAALTAPESRAMYDLTLDFNPALTLSYHTQGDTIYWKYLNYEPEGARAIAQRFSDVSGYAVEDTPYESGFAGYKDWFIQDYNLPGYTIEAGLGENPLPIRQLQNIYSDNIGILVLGSELTSSQNPMPLQ